jgi:L-histidine Nalpha-methyltransferase
MDMHLDSWRAAVAQAEGRLTLAHGRVRNGETSTLADDLRRGFRQIPKEIPPKHFYDEHGSQLFEAITETPEYYPTRAETALLCERAADIIEESGPVDLVEIGSGAARKTRQLLDAMGSGRYVPVDISEEILVASALDLLRDYDWLRVHGIVTDYERRFAPLLPPADTRLFAFLGGTLGNFDCRQAVEFLARIRGHMRPQDSFLLGIDLVKNPGALHAAYNDAAGVTAAFNRNVLRVINRELQADFELSNFEHVAFYRSDLERVEMHLRSLRDQTVRINQLNMRVSFSQGEMIRTEISRKFTRGSIQRICRAAGLRVRRWFSARNEWFALVLLASNES